MTDDFLRELSVLSASLPTGSVFEYEDDGDGLKLEILSVPSNSRGAGTPFLAKLFALCDIHGVAVRFRADATDIPGDPSTFELVRWYARFGCEIDVVDEDGAAMSRSARDPSGGLEAILAAYKAATSGDLTLDEFEGLRNRGHSAPRF